MDFKLLDLEDKLIEFNIQGDLEFFKEDKKALYFYLQERKGLFYLLSYQKESEEFLLMEKISYEIYKENFFMVNNLGRDKLVFSSYNNDEISIFTYSKNGVEKILEADQVHLLFSLSSRYYLLAREKISLLIDIELGRTYELDSPIFRDTFFYGTRLIKIRGENYIVHCKYSLDSYDFDYFFDSKGIVSKTSGVYILKLEELVDSINRKEGINYRTLIENTEKTYINPVDFNENFYLDKYRNKYYFYEVGDDKSLKLYGLESGDMELISKLSFAEYEDFLGIYSRAFPLEVGKYSNLYGYREWRKLYPYSESIIDYSSENLSLVKVTENYLLFVGYELRGNENFNYMELHSRKDRTSLMKLYGDYIFLEDRGRILLIKKWQDRVDGRKIYMENKDSNLRQLVSKILKGKEKNYNWFLIETRDDLKKQVSLEAGELANFNLDGKGLQRPIILAGFRQNKIVTENFTLEEDFPGLKPYFRNDLTMKFKDSDLELVILREDLILLITKDSFIIRSIDDKLDKVRDLSLENRVINGQVAGIKNILQSLSYDSKSIDGKAFEIWIREYSKDYLKKNISIEFEDIEKYL